MFKCKPSFLVLISLFLSIQCFSNEKIDSLMVELAKAENQNSASLHMDIGNIYYDFNLDSSYKYYLKGYKLGAGTDEKFRGLSNMIFILRSWDEVDSLGKYLPPSIDLASRLQDTMSMIRFGNEYTYFLSEKLEYKASLDWAKRGVKLYEAYIKDDSLREEKFLFAGSIVYNSIGVHYTHNSVFDSAVYYLIKSHRIKERMGGDPIRLAISCINIAAAYSKYSDYEKALEMGLKSLDYSLESGDIKRIGIAHQNIGVYYVKLKQFEKAKEHYDKAMKIYDDIDNKWGQFDMYRNYAGYYIKQDNFSNAKTYIDKLINFPLAKERPREIGKNLYLLADFYQEQENYDSAFHYSVQAEKFLRISGQKIELDRSLFIQAYSSNMLGLFKESSETFKRYYSIHDSIYNAEDSKRYYELQTKYEVAEMEKAHLISEAERKEQQQHIIQLIISIVAIFIIASIIVIFLSIKRRKDRIIFTQKEEVKERELENERLRKKELEQDIENKSKQLNTHALHMMQKNAMLHELQEKIFELGKAQSDKQQEVHQINHKISESLRADKDWDTFKLYFEQVNQDFFENLRVINPELTTNDQRLCALIHLNMNSKEMASVLNVSPNTIKSSRYRLKKKLNLSAEEDLEEFIRSV